MIDVYCGSQPRWHRSNGGWSDPCAVREDSKGWREFKFHTLSENPRCHVAAVMPAECTPTATAPSQHQPRVIIRKSLAKQIIAVCGDHTHTHAHTQNLAQYFQGNTFAHTQSQKFGGCSFAQCAVHRHVTLRGVGERHQPRTAAMYNHACTPRAVLRSTSA
jgi:hypothetical protein